MGRNSASGIFVATPPSRAERQKLLVDCPVCRVEGPRARLARHLTEDHGLADPEVARALRSV